MLPLHQSAIIRMEGIEPSTFGLSDWRSDLLSYIREVIVGFEPTITVLQTVVLTTWRYDPNVAYRTRTYNRKIRNLLHYPIMLMPHSRCNRIRTCIRRFWRPLHIHHAPHLWPTPILNIRASFFIEKCKYQQFMLIFAFFNEVIIKTWKERFHLSN